MSNQVAMRCIFQMYKVMQVPVSGVLATMSVVRWYRT